ncbi:MAG: LUD domain-containing protein, partial [Chloroflexota bacterium]
MVTSLPPVHIALMGIERIVPDMDALSLALSVLPRSATGQKITVYTQLINAPDPDNNPRERHLILVDNGRSNLRGSPLNDALLCIRCGACLNTCPIFREIGGHAYVGQHGQATTYPGPIGSVISPGLFGQSDFGHLAQACTVCGACKEACPANIDLPSMLLRVRANQRSGEQISMPIRGGLHIFRWFATNPWRFRLAQKLAALFSRIMSPKNNWMRLPSFTGWGYAKDFPRPAAKPFRVRFHSHQHTKQQSGEIQEPYHPQPQTVENLAPISKPELPADQRTLTEQFKDELFALDGTLIHCTAENLTTNILEFLGSQNITTITACEDSALPSGLANGLRQAGINIKHGLQPDVQVGLTGALAGVAETGTLAIPVSPGCPQETSLLPQIHLAVLYANKIYKNLAQILALREVQLASSTALISGPSRTADIEMTLTLGMHGPGQLIVFCID